MFIQWVSSKLPEVPPVIVEDVRQKASDAHEQLNNSVDKLLQLLEETRNANSESLDRLKPTQ